jgi:hypothetical protein
MFGLDKGVTCTLSLPPGLSPTIIICGPDVTKSPPVANLIPFTADIAVFIAPTAIAPAPAAKNKLRGNGVDFIIDDIKPDIASIV